MVLLTADKGWICCSVLRHNRLLVSILAVFTQSSRLRTVLLVTLTAIAAAAAGWLLLLLLSVFAVGCWLRLQHTASMGP
jgi:hypothetical protein